MPDSRDSRFSGVYDIVDVALFADVGEFSLFQGIMYSLVLMMGPLIVGTLLLITALVLAGDITIAEIVAALQTPQPQPEPIWTRPKELGFALLQNAIIVPVAWGVSMFTKVVIKILSEVRG